MSLQGALSARRCRGNGAGWGAKSNDRKRHILDLLCQCRNVGLHDVMACKCSPPGSCSVNPLRRLPAFPTSNFPSSWAFFLDKTAKGVFLWGWPRPTCPGGARGPGFVRRGWGSTAPAAAGRTGFGKGSPSGINRGVGSGSLKI